MVEDRDVGMQVARGYEALALSIAFSNESFLVKLAVGDDRVLIPPHKFCVFACNAPNSVFSIRSSHIIRWFEFRRRSYTK